MSRLCAGVFATALICAAVAPMSAYGQDVGLWPPNPSPSQSVGYALESVGGVLTNPCFFGGCRYDPRDACHPGGSCGGSWGGATVADERSTVTAYRALSRQASAMAAKGAVSPVTLDDGAAQGASRHVRRTSHNLPK
ncbi:hypothetical protein [Rhodoblastus sp.]|uniref:hypothetical protein n=1 Tax=Rhodoblastus sp. TaxID=1962975 RepID=UPI003F9A28C9